MHTKTNLFLFLALMTILFTSPFASGNAFADNQDKKPQPQPDNCASLGSLPEIFECLKENAKNALSIGSLKAVRDAVRYAIDAVATGDTMRQLGDIKLQNQVDELKGQNISLQNQVDELKGQNKLLQSQIDELKVQFNK